MKRTFIIVLACFILGSCVSVQIPIEEYTLARSAQEAAATAEAFKYAPQFYHRAQNHYKKGEYFYKERYYDKAKKQFQFAKIYAKRAETAARVKQFKSGDLNGF